MDEVMGRVGRRGEQSTRRTHYDILGVDPDASAVAIRLAFQRRWSGVDDSLTEARAHRQLLLTAYETLSDPALKAVYDSGLGHRPSVGAASSGATTPTGHIGVAVFSTPATSRPEPLRRTGMSFRDTDATTVRWLCECGRRNVPKSGTCAWCNRPRPDLRRP